MILSATLKSLNSKIAFLFFNGYYIKYVNTLLQKEITFCNIR